LDGSLAAIVKAGNREKLLGNKLLTVATAGGHPATPFVVGEDGEGDEDEGEEAEEDFHKKAGIRGQGTGNREQGTGISKNQGRCKGQGLRVPRSQRRDLGHPWSVDSSIARLLASVVNLNSIEEQMQVLRLRYASLRMTVLFLNLLLQHAPETEC
jgi:hypothetical protein